MSRHHERRATIQEFERVFEKEAALRGERGDLVDDLPEWVYRERWAMIQWINTLRAKRGKSPVTEEQFVRKEQCAEGHSDYQHKLCLYSMELVLDVD